MLTTFVSVLRLNRKLCKPPLIPFYHQQPFATQPKLLFRQPEEKEHQPYTRTQKITSCKIRIRDKGAVLRSVKQNSTQWGQPSISGQTVQFVPAQDLLPRTDVRLSTLLAVAWNFAKGFYRLEPNAENFFILFNIEFLARAEQWRLQFDFRKHDDRFDIVHNLNFLQPRSHKVLLTEPWIYPDNGLNNSPTRMSFDEVEGYVRRFLEVHHDFGEAEANALDEYKTATSADTSVSDPKVVQDAATAFLASLNQQIFPRRVASVIADCGDAFGARAGKGASPRVRGHSVKARTMDWCVGRPYSGTAEPKHRAMVAFGSNLGDRIYNIDEAIQEMQRRQLNVKAISSLFETTPMYVFDQGTFLNGVCEVETDLRPLELLDMLQGIEKDLGREKHVDKGPRNIDLDIVLYDYENISHERLHIPHQFILEREFVLRPLAELIPLERLPPPFDSRSILVHLNNVADPSPKTRPMAVTAIAPHLPLMRPMNPTRSTQLMAVLNLTPDSFSDGGVHSGVDVPALDSTVRGFIEAGATIIDVGGQSTRPNATTIAVQEELDRIIPAIKHIRSMPEVDNVAISVDTFYAQVAEEAVAAGADIINDISAGTIDAEMLATAAKVKRAVVLMHMRGTPQTMTQMTDYPKGVIEGIGEELLERVKAARAAGILPWRIILDPGVGFAKTQAQNLELLRRFNELRAYEGLQGFPWIIGTSRKGFIGKITGVQKADERAWGTAATVTASIRGGADIVRVHDVAEMSQVTKMADAMFRVEPSSQST